MGGPRFWKNLPVDVAAVLAVADKIQSDVTDLLGVTGTLAPAEITLVQFGAHPLCAPSALLSNCNIGKVTLTDCFTSNADGATLDLSDNRMDATAIADLVAAMYTAIVTGASGASGTLDLQGNAEPNAATMGMIYALCQAGWTITITLPGTVTGTSDENDIPNQIYTYFSEHGQWLGATIAAIYYSGSAWVIDDNIDMWIGPADSMAGDYVLLGRDTITVTLET